MRRAGEYLIKEIFKAPVRLYRYAISPLFGQSCRFHPSCSAYMLEALDRHGVVKGLFLATRRLLCCHPWCKTHWHDPVPKRFTWGEFIGYKRKQNSQIRDHCK